MSEALRVEMMASAVQSSSSNSATFAIPTGSNLMVGVDCTAGASSPVLDLWLQASDDGGTTWYDYPHDIAMKSANSATEVAPTTNVRSIIDNKTTTTAETFVGIYRGIATDRIRLKWILTGGTITFSASYVVK